MSERMVGRCCESSSGFEKGLCEMRPKASCDMFAGGVLVEEQAASGQGNPAPIRPCSKQALPRPAEIRAAEVKDDDKPQQGTTRQPAMHALFSHRAIFPRASAHSAYLAAEACGHGERLHAARRAARGKRLSSAQGALYDSHTRLLVFNIHLCCPIVSAIFFHSQPHQPQRPPFLLNSRTRPKPFGHAGSCLEPPAVPSLHAACHVTQDNGFCFSLPCGTSTEENGAISTSVYPRNSRFCRPDCVAPSMLVVF
ncbi:hypothetical protein M011DRAFT_49782 [Sporormia fimetaria CBS 119925]|uniref:Uncharacterized protein n=1 Tax=Sporormia fimetaria CBS 119925 TaxID=1340428 RepID=A0A6A6VEN6_9PLEO|nr:hypothetical protein M011DRAFT_49782 [Sporormia fimetaria CBS 119925]